MDVCIIIYGQKKRYELISYEKDKTLIINAKNISILDMIVVFDATAVTNEMQTGN